MREIKFKFWDKKEKVMSVIYTIEQLCNGYFNFNGDNKAFEKLQFTGLLDNNGVEIYFDCELLKHKKLNKTVLFIKDDFGIPMISDCKDCLNSISFEEFFIGRDYAIKDFEVIGNIYENPELLGKADVHDA